MICGAILSICLAIFGVGYVIGYSAFASSEKRKSYAVISGITAVVVTFGLLFAGCLVLLNGANFH